MNNAKGEVGKAILVSLCAIWFCAIAAFLVIRLLFDAYVGGRENEVGSLAPISIFTLRPSLALIFGALLSILFLIHWWISGLFGKGGMSRKPVANLMLVGAGLCAALELFENGARDFYEYSLFCRSGEPISVVFIDEIYQCERSRLVRSALWWMIFLLPILAIPVRIIESRLGASKA